MKGRVLACALAAASLGAQQPGQPGTRVAALPLADPSGRALNPATTGKVTAVVFVSTRCPISNDYNERMQALYSDYRERVDFVFVNSNFNEPSAEVEQHAREHAFSFVVRRDPDHRAADLFAAQSTPESFVIDRDGVIRYRGRIDDARNPARVTTKNLRLALEAVLAGQVVQVPEAKAFGCTIKRGKRTT